IVKKVKPQVPPLPLEEGGESDSNRALLSLRTVITCLVQATTGVIKCHLEIPLIIQQQEVPL
ncbi:hypothetical protein, partial [Methylocaldum sp. 14B]|uniref:hypothetical protein n=1 Tax=Methylocaldum sp. 14B TaxID=1912213 RepID=UPI00197BF22F